MLILQGLSREGGGEGAELPLRVPLSPCLSSVPGCAVTPEGLLVVSSPVCLALQGTLSWQDPRAGPSHGWPTLVPWSRARTRWGWENSQERRGVSLVQHEPLRGLGGSWVNRRTLKSGDGNSRPCVTVVRTGGGHTKTRSAFPQAAERQQVTVHSTARGMAEQCLEGNGVPPPSVVCESRLTAIIQPLSVGFFNKHWCNRTIKYIKHFK